MSCVEELDLTTNPTPTLANLTVTRSPDIFAQHVERNAQFPGGKGTWDSRGKRRRELLLSLDRQSYFCAQSCQSQSMEQ